MEGDEVVTKPKREIVKGISKNERTKNKVNHQQWQNRTDNNRREARTACITFPEDEASWNPIDRTKRSTVRGIRLLNPGYW